MNKAPIIASAVVGYCWEKLSDSLTAVAQVPIAPDGIVKQRDSDHIYYTQGEGYQEIRKLAISEWLRANAKPRRWNIGIPVGTDYDHAEIFLVEAKDLKSLLAETEK